MAHRTKRPPRRRREPAALGLYGGFSLTHALAYCAACIADALAGAQIARLRRSPQTVSTMNGDFMRITAGR
ncbi:MAG: hypothetical protein AAGH87_07010 [Pseudomonadota bacterium]